MFIEYKYYMIRDKGNNMFVILGADLFLRGGFLFARRPIQRKGIGKVIDRNFATTIKFYGKTHNYCYFQNCFIEMINEAPKWYFRSEEEAKSLIEKKVEEYNKQPWWKRLNSVI